MFLQIHRKIIMVSWYGVFILQNQKLTAQQSKSYPKNPKHSNTQKFAVITLNFEQSGFTIE